MCSVADDEADEINFMKSETPLRNIENEECRKCNQQKASIILRKRDPYCKECFLTSVVHKFRASLGKSKLVRAGDKVLIGFSGNAASSALLELVKLGLSEAAHKKLRFQPFLLYIDDGIITHSTKEERHNRKDSIQQMMASEANIPAYFSSISDVLKTEPNFIAIDENLEINDVLDSQIKNLFTSASTLTAKQDLLKKYRQQLLLDCATELKCSFILVADTATKLAANLLASVSLGGGSHLSSDVGFCDSRNKIRILRPMRDFMTHDLNYFLEFNNICYLPHKSMASGDNPYASIQTLTNKFVNDLQENFPSTICAVIRTGEKMENKTNTPLSEDEMCALCVSHLDTQTVVCSALQATEYSRKISNQTFESGEPAVNGKCGNCTCKGSDAPLTRSELEAFLCYSCRLVMRDVKDISLLPKQLVSSIRIKKSLLDTRNQIQDFLL